MTKAYWDEEFDLRAWDETERWQASMLPAFIRRLQENSDLYRERLAPFDADKIDEFTALKDLPFTIKDELRHGQAQGGDKFLGLQQSASSDEVVQVLSSSGTTGQPVFYGLTANDLVAWRDALANLYFTAGLRSHSVAALSTGMPIVAGGLAFADGIRETGASLVWFGGQTTERMVDTMTLLPINALVGTASFQTHFARRVEEVLGRPASTLSVDTVIAGGEPGLGHPEIRASILESYGATRISEVMGLADVLPGIWAECEEGGGMHLVTSRDVIVELIDPSDDSSIRWSEGAEGELVYTTFTREATPVLRYRSGDRAIVTATSCACGRTSPRIRCIGRTDDMLIYKAMNVFPTAIRDLALSIAPTEIKDVMRIRKESADQVRFDHPIPLEVEARHQLDEGRQEEIRQGIEREIQQKLRVRVAVEMKEPGTFDLGFNKNKLTYVAQQ